MNLFAVAVLFCVLCILSGVPMLALFIALVRYGTLWREINPDDWIMRHFCKPENLELQRQCWPPEEEP